MSMDLTYLICNYILYVLKEDPDIIVIVITLIILQNIRVL